MFDVINWYFNSVAEFWGMAIRIGLPQLLLVILLICWLRRRKCGESSAESCWTWVCGRDGGCCCCRTAGAQEAEEAVEEDDS